MINRRNFLLAAGCCATALQLAGLASAADSHADLKIETLHRLSGEHPGFAYFAGLPGHLGMPSALLAQWFATAEASAALTDLQNACDNVCFIVGSVTAEHDITQFGPYAAVERGLGPPKATETFELRADMARSIAPHGSTLAVTMPRSSWRKLHDKSKTAIAAAAARLPIADAASAVRQPTQRSALIDTSSVSRIAEAVVAEMANHDALTRRINANYFAFKNAHMSSKLKNDI